MKKVRAAIQRNQNHSTAHVIFTYAFLNKLIEQQKKSGKDSQPP